MQLGTRLPGYEQVTRQSGGGWKRRFHVHTSALSNPRIQTHSAYRFSPRASRLPAGHLAFLTQTGIAWVRGYQWISR